MGNMFQYYVGVRMGGKYMSIGIAMGVAIGASVGLMVENLTTWAGLGVAAGTAVGFGMAIAKAARSKPELS
jgi:hypothetical protein